MEHTVINQPQTVARVTWRALVAPLMALGLLVAALWNLSGPPMWWDEGWTLSVSTRGRVGLLE